ncbi:MAG: TraR/DksA C4-type zinc finger protein [Candidatus Cloacimonetes bacterium]|nr:TraR/DksA C4-type zinc finger protein [Candidatus Cloacimonadota bacterium]
MEREQLDFYRDLLMAERKKVVKIIEGIDENLSNNIRDAVGNVSLYATHLADLGTDSDEREKETYMLDRELRNLKNIDNALKRIHDKTYGICNYCGDEILSQRLKAIPYAELCIDCKRNEERINNNNHR